MLVVRFSFNDDRYNKPGEGKCWEMWSSHLPNEGPYCMKLLDHDENHEGGGMVWAEEPQVEIDTARRFLAAYRRIPNSGHAITLTADGVVMTLKAFEASVLFLGVSMHGDG